jgi:RNA polymerase sigma-70 factor, ECF subfamily
MPDTTPPDEVLVKRARAGDAAAFDALVRRHFRAAYALALTLVSSRADAEDVCQDSFIRALERLDDCREPAKFAQWLLQIVRRRSYNLRAYLKVRAAQALEHGTIAGPDSPARDAERADLRALLEAALRRLTRIQREVVLLHDLEGWTHRAIGEALGISETLSRQHLFVARRFLRRVLHTAYGRQAGD